METQATGPESRPFSIRSNAARDARRVLGEKAERGTDFVINSHGDRDFRWARVDRNVPKNPRENGAASNGHDTTAKPKVERKAAPKAAPKPKAAKPTASAKPTTAARDTKKTAVVAMLQRENKDGTRGATVPEICEATDWLPHTLRAFIAVTVVRKEGHNVHRSRTDKVTRYWIE